MQNDKLEEPIISVIIFWEKTDWAHSWHQSRVYLENAHIPIFYTLRELCYIKLGSLNPPFNEAKV